MSSKQSVEKSQRKRKHESRKWCAGKLTSPIPNQDRSRDSVSYLDFSVKCSLKPKEYSTDSFVSNNEACSVVFSNSEGDNQTVRRNSHANNFSVSQTFNSNASRDEHFEDKFRTSSANSLHIRDNLQECMINVNIDKNILLCFVDSGASHCMVGNGLFDCVPSLKDRLQNLESAVTARAINGSEIIYTECLDFYVSIQGRDFFVHALYSPEISYTLVLGFDFLQENEIVIDFSNMAVNTEEHSVVKLCDTIKLGPSSETVVWGYANPKQEFGTGFISNADVLLQRDLYVTGAVTVYSSSNSKIP